MPSNGKNTTNFFSHLIYIYSVGIFIEGIIGRVVGGKVYHRDVGGALILIFLAQMGPFKSTKGLRRDKLSCLYSRNNWNVSFFEFLEFGPFLASCSVFVPPDYPLKFFLVSVYDVKEKIIPKRKEKK